MAVDQFDPTGWVRMLADDLEWCRTSGIMGQVGDKLTTVGAPLTISSHTDLGRSLNLSFGAYYQVLACNKAGCSPFLQ